MLSRLSQSLRQLARKLVLAERVGVDQGGNQYFRQPKIVDGAESERRWVKFKEHPDPRKLPVEWTSWLSNTRPDPPSPEEIEHMEAQRKMVKFKASLLQAEEEKRQFRAKSLKQGMPAEDVRPEGMERLMRQIAAGEAASVEATAEASSERPDGGGAAEYKGPSSRPTGIHRPEYWQPPDASARGAEPTGRGPTFQPGAWNPGEPSRDEPKQKETQFEPGHWQPPPTERR